jgi:membrane dipeptidase
MPDVVAQHTRMTARFAGLAEVPVDRSLLRRGRVPVRFLCATLLATLSASAGVAFQAPPGNDADLVARARAIHERVITLDTHADIDPAHFQPACNYTQRLTTQVNLPKMKEGGLDAAFFIVYVGQGPLTAEGYADAYRQAIAKFDAIHRLTEQIAPKEIGLALTAADVTRIARSGRKVAIVGIENGYAIGTDVARVREFYTRGGRYLSLAHNGHNQLSDSNTGEASGDAPNKGISPLGRQVIAEMNRLGMMVDISHPSKASMMQAAELSRAPIIASHSAVRALANHSRNLDDDQLRALKKNGGVVQIVAFANYIRAEAPERVRARQSATTALQMEFGIAAGRGRGAGTPLPTASCPVEPAAGAPAAAGGRADGQGPATPTPERRAEYERRLARIQAEFPAVPRATVRDFVDHIDYAVKLIGIDHVGISSDFDGGGGIDGWDSAAETFNVTLELVRRGYSEADIGKLWSGNLLRVWQEVEIVAARLQAGAR